MAKEDPILRKCCCIIPIRPSLVIFAVFKIIGDIIGTGFFGYTWLMFAVNSSGFIYSLLIILSLILDISIMILLIIGVTKKNSFILKISYYYSIISLLTAGITLITLLVLVYTSDFYLIDKYIYSSNISLLMNLLIHVAVICSYILLHIYMILLMKGQITKMSNVGNYDVCNDQESTRLSTERDSEYPYGRYQ